MPYNLFFIPPPIASCLSTNTGSFPLPIFVGLLFSASIPAWLALQLPHYPHLFISLSAFLSQMLPPTLSTTRHFSRNIASLNSVIPPFSCIATLHLFNRQLHVPDFGSVPTTFPPRNTRLPLLPRLPTDLVSHSLRFQPFLSYD